jgi:6-phosphogluconolactonase/glucosamine-6-phosphate isomerase/deaminase
MNVPPLPPPSPPNPRPTVKGRTTERNPRKPLKLSLEKKIKKTKTKASQKPWKGEEQTKKYKKKSRQNLNICTLVDGIGEEELGHVAGIQPHDDLVHSCIHYWLFRRKGDVLEDHNLMALPDVLLTKLALI